jgi:hypothetical protein
MTAFAHQERSDLRPVQNRAAAYCESDSGADEEAAENRR